MINLKAIRQAAEESQKTWQYAVITNETVIALLDRLEAAEKDAARYHHLFNSTDGRVYAAFRKVYDFWDGCDHKAGFDKAIDAAMRGDL